MRTVILTALACALGGCSSCSPSAAKPRREEHPPAPPIASGTRAKVDWIADGDTMLVILPDGQKAAIRVLGIDCPESKHNAKCERDGREGRLGCDAQVPLGKAATKYAISLLKGRDVTVETRDGNGTTENDVYGRALAYVRLPDGRDFGLQMVHDAKCSDFGWRYPHPRMDRYKAAERD
jgi:endonuclease YncB( thermonuclease family)